VTALEAFKRHAEEESPAAPEVAPLADRRWWRWWSFPLVTALNGLEPPPTSIRNIGKRRQRCKKLAARRLPSPWSAPSLDT